MKKLTQDEVRQTQMAILDEIVKVCEKNNLRYYLAFGSLLGAVRHNGYIPWDDDIDIALERDDYEKLLCILKDKNAGNQDWLSVIDDTDKNYFYPFSKAVDNRTEVKMDRHHGNHGVWVDLFPIDGLPSSEWGTKIFIVLCGLLRVICLAMSTKFSSHTLSFGTLLYKRFFNALATIIGKKRVCRIVDKVFSHYQMKNSKKVAILFTGYMFKVVFDKEELLSLAKYKFENREYAGFANYDLYLKQLYGDYMTLPPEEKRITHAFDVWWK